MRKLSLVFVMVFMMMFVVSCGESDTRKAIELMGAGDRIHDSFTFANVGVEIEEKENNVYRIFGSVEKLQNESIKTEFNIENDVNYVVAIKLSSIDSKVVDDKLKVKVDGVRSYDSGHLNGLDYTFIILEAVKGKTVSISVSWDGEEELNYIVKFDEDLILK